MLTIAIDFDNTLTADAELWRNFLATAGTLKHRVICVTARRNTDENRETIKEWMQSHLGGMIPFFFCDLKSKIGEMERRGINVDIWIDDDPTTLVNGH